MKKRLREFAEDLAKFGLAAMLVCLGVAFAVLVVITVVKVAPIVSHGAQTATQNTFDFVGAFFSAFLVKFFLLTLIYAIAFTLVAVVVECLWPKLTGKSEKTFKETCGKCFSVLGTDNNRRWLYLALMTMLTLVIAFGNPGPSLLISGIKHLPDNLLSEGTQRSIGAQWNFFLNGNKNPAAASENTTSLVETTWFWWNAFFVYLGMTFVYFFFAFWDEFVAACKKGYEVFKEHYEAHRKRELEKQTAKNSALAAAPTTPTARNPQGTSPQATVVATAPGSSGTPAVTATATVASTQPGTPAPSVLGKFGWGSLFTAELAAEVIGAMLHEFIDHRINHRGTRLAGGVL